MKWLIVLAFASVTLALPQYNYAPPAPGGYSSGGSSFASAGPSGGHHHGGGGQVEVTKDIYVHVAPESPHEQLSSPPQPPQVARKHYKIIFIKAPSHQPQQQQLAAIPPSQHEEKTIVYVLVKKPEQLQLDSPPAPPPHVPSKPEVYFIKYRAQQEQGHAHGGNSFSPAGPPAQEYGPPALPQIAPAPAPVQQGYQKKK